MSGRPLALAVLGRGVVDPDQPWLHADDAGVLRGRAAFETMRVYGGRAFRLQAHLERLVGSAEVLGLPMPEPEPLARLAVDAVAACGRPDATLRVVWTGGREGSGDGVGLPPDSSQSLSDIPRLPGRHWPYYEQLGPSLLLEQALSVGGIRRPREGFLLR